MTAAERSDTLHNLDSLLSQAHDDATPHEAATQIICACQTLECSVADALLEHDADPDAAYRAMHAALNHFEATAGQAIPARVVDDSFQQCLAAIRRKLGR